MANERSQSGTLFAVRPSGAPLTDSSKNIDLDGITARAVIGHHGRNRCSDWNQREDAQQIAAADRDEHHSFNSTTTFSPGGRARRWADLIGIRHLGAARSRGAVQKEDRSP